VSGHGIKQTDDALSGGRILTRRGALFPVSDTQVKITTIHRATAAGDPDSSATIRRRFQ
jgi:hypothetical protein